MDLCDEVQKKDILTTQNRCIASA